MSTQIYARLTDLFDGFEIPVSDGNIEIQLVSEILDSSSYKYTNGEVSSQTENKKGDNSIPGTTVLFEGAEHTFLGDSIELTLDGGSKTASGSYNFAMSNGASLTYGQILALGGDFYGIPGSPIYKGGSKVFKQAFDSLDQGDTDELADILSVMQDEIDLASQAYLNGENVADAYKDTIGNSNSAKWNQITLGTPKAIWQEIPNGLGTVATLPFIFPAGRYLQLANNNIDHFGKYALSAYYVGHKYACDLAASAKSPNDLLVAYQMNAFADHFLSDLFAAGHLRTPRYLLQQDVSDISLLPAIAAIAISQPWLAGFLVAMKYFGGYEYGIIGNMLSKQMHDEDNTFGLNVSNTMPTPNLWRCYGDAHLLSEANAESMSLTIQAIQASANDVYTSYTKRKAVTGGALLFIPSIDALTNNTNIKQNFSPLYRLLDGKLQERSDRNDKNNYDWDKCWNGGISLIALLSNAEDNEAKIPNNFPIPPKTFVPVVNPGLWNQKSPYGSNWIDGNQFRYAVGFQYKFPNYPTLIQSSDRGPWMEWTPVKGWAEAGISLPALPAYAIGWNIYRQFKIDNGSTIQPWKKVGTVNPSTPNTVEYITPTYYFRDPNQ